jgi:hypothetical protein
MEVAVPMASLPTENVGSQLDDAPPDHRLDPLGPGVDERQLHEAAAQRAG